MPGEEVGHGPEFVPVRDVFGQALHEIEHRSGAKTTGSMHIGAEVEQHAHRVDLVGGGGAGERGALVVGAAGVYLGVGFEQEAGALRQTEEQSPQALIGVGTRR